MSRANLNRIIAKARRASPSGTLGGYGSTGGGGAGVKGSYQATGGGTTIIVYDPQSDKTAVIDLNRLTAEDRAILERGRQITVQERERIEAEKKAKEEERLKRIEAEKKAIQEKKAQEEAQKRQTVQQYATTLYSDMAPKSTEIRERLASKEINQTKSSYLNVNIDTGEKRVSGTISRDIPESASYIQTPYEVYKREVSEEPNFLKKVEKSAGGLLGVGLATEERGGLKSRFLIASGVALSFPTSIIGTAVREGPAEAIGNVVFGTAEFLLNPSESLQSKTPTGKIAELVGVSVGAEAITLPYKVGKRIYEARREYVFNKRTEIPQSRLNKVVILEPVKNIDTGKVEVKSKPIAEPKKLPKETQKKFAIVREYLPKKEAKPTFRKEFEQRKLSEDKPEVYPELSFRLTTESGKKISAVPQETQYRFYKFEDKTKPDIRTRIKYIQQSNIPEIRKKATINVITEYKQYSFTDPISASVISLIEAGKIVKDPFIRFMKEAKEPITYITENVRKLKPGVIVYPKTNARIKQSPYLEIYSGIKSRTNVKPEETVISDIKQEQIPEDTVKSAVIQIQEQRAGQRQRQEQRQQQRQEQIQALKLETRYRLTSKAVIDTPFTPRPRIIGDTGKKRGKTGLFAVEVKKRGFFKPFGVYASPQDAIIRGREEVRRSASASFRVRPLNRDADISSLASNLLPYNEFRKSKVDPNIYVQRRERRISSAGEKREITYRGISFLRGKRRF